MTLKNPYASNRTDYVFNLLNPKKTDKILNIGISNIPEVEQSLEPSVAECWTIDIDKQKISAAAHFLKKTHLLHEDITKKTTLKDNYFDKVTMIEVLEHIKDDRAALRFINKKLKPSGILIIAVPNDAFLHYFNPVKYAEHERHYSNALIRQRLQEAGFTIEHFNLVERWTLLANLYIHLFRKFVLRQNRPFGVFTTLSHNSYKQQNRRGMDIIIKARKI